MKSWIVHYKNKYPNCQIKSSDSSFDVYGKDGEHFVSLVKTGAGQWKDVSEEVGALFSHDLSPIPKDARVHKEVDGKVGLDELADERKKLREEYIEGGRVLSCEELKQKGYDFCKDSQRLLGKRDIAPKKDAKAPKNA